MNEKNKTSFMQWTAEQLHTRNIQTNKNQSLERYRQFIELRRAMFDTMLDSVGVCLEYHEKQLLKPKRDIKKIEL